MRGQTVIPPLGCCRTVENAAYSSLLPLRLAMRGGYGPSVTTGSSTRLDRRGSRLHRRGAASFGGRGYDYPVESPSTQAKTRASGALSAAWSSASCSSIARI